MTRVRSGIFLWCVEQPSKQNVIFALIHKKAAIKAKGQKAPLREDEEAQQKIRDLWKGGERTRAEIAHKIGHNPRTVQSWIKQALESGDLSPE